MPTPTSPTPSRQACSSPERAVPLTVPAPARRSSAVRIPQQRRAPRDVPAGADDGGEEVLARAAAGESSAWAQLYLRYNGVARSVARRHRLSDADVDDVTQRTWLLLVEHVHELRDPQRLGGWIATTAHRECLALHRHRQRLLPVPEVTRLAEEESQDESEEPATALIRQEQATALRSALSVLPVHQRRVVEALLATPEASYRDLSDRLGVPVGSIGPTRQRALQRLRRVLAAADVDALIA